MKLVLIMIHGFKLCPTNLKKYMNHQALPYREEL